MVSLRIAKPSSEASAILDTINLMARIAFVVGRDDIVNRARVAIGVHHRNDGDVERIRFAQRRLFAAHVHDEQRARQALHIANAAQPQL